MREQESKKLSPDAANVPAGVVRRLPRYFRYLRALLDGGCERISSAELSRKMGVTASQIRQDLNWFGGFGQQGYGYHVKDLYEEIGALLGVDEGYTAIIVGAGNLGHALALSPMFPRRGVTRLALFDVDEEKVGTEIDGLPILHVDTLERYCKENRVDIAVLTTPKSEAAEMVDRLAKAGVRGIWNFSSTEIKNENKAVFVENIHLGDSLMKLCFDLRNGNEA